MSALIPQQRTTARNLVSGDLVSFRGDQWVVLANVAGAQRLSAGPRPRALTLSSLTRHRTITVQRAVDTELDRLAISRSMPSWEVGFGDVVLFDQGPVATWSVAIRHGNGWVEHSVRSRIPDAKVRYAVHRNQAQILRSSAFQPHFEPRVAARMWMTGTVLATKDLAAEPLAWLHVEPNLWRSTNGVEASNLMIRQGWERQIYSLLYVKE